MLFDELAIYFYYDDMQKKSANASFYVASPKVRFGGHVATSTKSISDQKKRLVAHLTQPATRLHAETRETSDAKQTTVTVKRQIKWHCQPIYSILLSTTCKLTTTWVEMAYLLQKSRFLQNPPQFLYSIVRRWQACNSSM